MKQLERLRQELQETKILLGSARLSETTRYVLERLEEDLENRIAELEEHGLDVRQSPKIPEPEGTA